MIQCLKLSCTPLHTLSEVVIETSEVIIQTYEYLKLSYVRVCLRPWAPRREKLTSADQEAGVSRHNGGDHASKPKVKSCPCIENCFEK